ncbi:hypothetical protein CR513_02193, partial [Mucuna pruriens]
MGYAKENIKSNFNNIKKRLVKDLTKRNKINMQLIEFMYARGLSIFSMDNAKTYRKIMLLA